MCYKDEVQRKNAEKLQKKFEEDNVPAFIRDYFSFMNSEAGKLNYWGTIKKFLIWCIERNDIRKDSISDITPDDLDGIKTVSVIVFLEDLIKNGITPSTMQVKKNILGSFWEYMVNNDYVRKNIVHNIPKLKFKIKKKNNAKVPLPEDMMEMIEKIKKKKDNFVRERNLVIVRVLKGTGLRESELAGLDLKDLHLEDSKPYITVMGKGVYYTQDAEPVLVSKDAKLAFKEWLKIRGEVKNIIDTKAVFINKNGKRLSEDNIQAIFRNYSRGKITPHMMRHLYATVLYQESGHDAAFVQEQLRHASSDTTLSIYASGNTETNYEVLENL